MDRLPPRWLVEWSFLSMNAEVNSLQYDNGRVELDKGWNEHALIDRCW